jgi:hypothetical protein
MSGGGARKAVWGLVLLLAVLHYDFWYWDDPALVSGILPVGLFYHAAFSIAATCVWALVVKLAWPSHLEVWAGETKPETDAPER